MTRVAIVTNDGFTVANFRRDLVRELAGRGIEVVALAPNWTTETRARAEAIGARTVDISLSRTGMNPVRDLRDVAALTATLRRVKPDAVLTYFVKPNIYGSIAARLAGVPRRVAMVEGLGFVFDAGEGGSLKGRALRAVTKALYRIAFSGVDRVLFLNRDDEAVFRDQGMVAADKAVNIGGIGVDLEAFAPAPPVTDPVTFLLMARLLRGKGIVEYCEAAARVKAVHPRARFVLLGDVDANPESLRAEDIAPWVEREVIEWPGHVDDVRGAIAGCSVFVLPAWAREGLPRSTQEASAMAKPVITTDGVGCRDTVEHGVNGLMIPRRDVDALAAAMMWFVENPHAIATMGAASRRIAETRYDGAAKSRVVADLLVG